MKPPLNPNPRTMVTVSSIGEERAKRVEMRREWEGEERESKCRAR